MRTRHKFLILIGIPAIVAISIAAVISADCDHDAFRTDLGVVEAHPSHDPVDSGTPGRAEVKFEFDDDEGRVEVNVNDENIVRKAHLHCL